MSASGHQRPGDTPTVIAPRLARPKTGQVDRQICRLRALEDATGIDAGGRGGDGCRWSDPLPLPIQASVERRDQLPFKVPVRGYLGRPGHPKWAPRARTRKSMLAAEQ